MNELANKLINDHKNPIVKVNLPGSKLFLKCSTPEESEFVEVHRANFEKLFRHERVERRCGRSQADWSRENELAKVTKVVKTLLHNFGYQDKNGTFLYPEETLFLMETNRLEVTTNKLPLSIQEGYDLLFRHKCSLTKYRVYKKLALLGYRILRNEEILRRESKDRKKDEGSCKVEKLCEKRFQKRALEDKSAFENETKRVCTRAESNKVEVHKNISAAGGSNVPEKDLGTTLINHIFEKLQKTAPKMCEPVIDSTEVPDYCIFSPNNKSRQDYDFNLFICKGEILERKNYNYSKSSIFAVCPEDNISFYKFSNVRLPFLN